MNHSASTTDHYQDLAAKLKSSREDKNLSIDQVCRRTRLSRDTIIRLEAGDFDFTTPLFVKGYLKQLSSVFGLEGETIVEDFERIRQKLHFVSQDMYAVPVGTVFPDEETIPPPDPLRDSDPTEMLTLDEKVVRKITKEKRMNRLMTYGGAILAMLCLLFLLFDDRETVMEETHETMPAAETGTILTAAKLRKKWQLSDPILSEQEVLLKQTNQERVAADSLRRAQFMKNHFVRRGQSVVPISVQEAGRELEMGLAGSRGMSNQ